MDEDDGNEKSVKDEGEQEADEYEDVDVCLGGLHKVLPR